MTTPDFNDSTEFDALADVRARHPRSYSFGEWCESLAFVMDAVIGDEAPEEQARAVEVMQTLNPRGDL